MKWDEKQIAQIKNRYRKQMAAVYLSVELTNQRELLAELKDPGSGADFAEITDQEHVVEALQRMLTDEAVRMMLIPDEDEL